MKNKGIMKINVCKRLMFAVCFAAGVAVYGQDATGHVNPFLSEFNTPYGVPPFEQITVTDYREGFLKGMEEQKQEIDAIVNQRSMPDFENTIVALDRSGADAEPGSLCILWAERMQYECRDAGVGAGNGSVAFGS